MGVEIGGVNALDQGSDSTQATGNSTSPTSPTVTTSQASEILLGFGAMNEGSGSTFSGYGSGWTGIVAGSQEAEYQITSSTGNYTATATVARADNWVEGIFTFYQAPAITLNPQTVASGYTSVGTVGLAAPAPAGGATVTLSSGNPAVATVPASVLVPAGSASATFTVNTSSVSSALVNISATYNSVTNVAALAVVPVNASPQYSIWSSSAAPTVSDDGGTSPVEVGVKFTADATGFISGIRFFKSSANTGAHIGNLWTSSGQLLATAAFTGETASGWQQVNFPSPILVTANTIYVASYHTTTGHTSDDHAYFTNIGVDNPPLHAPASGASGGNGVLTLSAGSTFPTTTNSDSNYWSDVAFITSSSALPLQSLTVNPTNVRGGLTANGTVTLNIPAPSGGALVALSTSNLAVATVPPSVLVAPGATSATFTLYTNPVAASTPVIISASLAGAIASSTLTVTPPAITSVTLNPTSGTGGVTNPTGTVTLNAIAPTGGLTVNLSSDNTGAATVPGSITVAAATTATFTVTSHTVTSTSTANISATFNGVTQSATLTVMGSPPVITTNPTSQTVTAGATVTFTAAASGTPAPTVQWQVSTNGGTTFSNVTGATSTTLSFATTAGQNSNQYRAVFTQYGGQRHDHGGDLDGEFGTGDHDEPDESDGDGGGDGDVHGGGQRNAAPTVQWQVSTNGGTTFSNVTGATSTTLSFATTAAQNGNQYRAVFTNTAGNATTTAATLTVNSAPAITTNPTSQTVTAGATATFTAAASGTPTPTVQWQVSTNGGTTFSNVTGATSTTLSFATTAAQNGNQYQAVFTNTAGNATTHGGDVDGERRRRRSRRTRRVRR